MKPVDADPGATLLREMALLQGKLFLDAARDLVLSPVLLVACVADLVMLRRQPPRWFHAALRLGKRSDEWIDLWSPVEQREKAPENVDALVDRIEALIRDPRTGARRARVLKRWLERHLARQRHAGATLTPPPEALSPSMPGAPVPPAPPAPPAPPPPPAA